MTRIALPLVTSTKGAQAHPYPLQIAYQTQEFIQGFMFYAAFSDLAAGQIVRMPNGIQMIESQMKDRGLSAGVAEQGWQIMHKYTHVFQDTIYQSVLISLNSHWDWYIRKLSEFIEFCRTNIGGPVVSAKDEKRLKRASRLPLVEQIEVVELTAGIQLALSEDQRNELNEMSLVRNLGLHNRWEIDSTYLRETVRTGLQLGDLRTIDIAELQKWHRRLVELLQRSSIECAKVFKMAPDFRPS